MVVFTFYAAAVLFWCIMCTYITMFTGVEQCKNIVLKRPLMEICVKYIFVCVSKDHNSKHVSFTGS